MQLILAIFSKYNFEFLNMQIKKCYQFNEQVQSGGNG